MTETQNDTAEPEPVPESESERTQPMVESELTQPTQQTQPMAGPELTQQTQPMLVEQTQQTQPLAPEQTQPMPEPGQTQPTQQTQPLAPEQTQPVAPPQGFSIPAQGFAMPASPAAPEGFAVAATEKPKRRIGSGKLFAGALVLGVLGGVGTGYAVQATRPPTPLPSLAGSQPKYPPSGVYQGIAPSPLPTSQDDAARTESDLTKLLLPKPAGASDADSSWVDQMINVEQDAYLCNDPSRCYTDDYSDGVEALADTEWTTSDGFFVEIRMYRFRAGHSDSAHTWEADLNVSGSRQIPTPTGVTATGLEFRDSYGANDDHIYAVHGDILVSVWVSSTTKMPDPALIDGVVTQQMARL